MIPVDQRHDFRSARRSGPEIALHGRRDAKATRFPHATNRHARVNRLDNDGHAPGLQLLDQQVGNLLGHAFLDLRPPGNLFDDAGQLA